MPTIDPKDVPWGPHEEALRQEFRDKIMPICDEYSDLLGEQAILSEFFGAIVSYLIVNDLVQDEAGALNFGVMLASALAVALDVELDFSSTVFVQSGDYNA